MVVIQSILSSFVGALSAAMPPDGSSYVSMQSDWSPSVRSLSVAMLSGVSSSVVYAVLLVSFCCSLLTGTSLQSDMDPSVSFCSLVRPLLLLFRRFSLLLLLCNMVVSLCFYAVCT